MNRFCFALLCLLLLPLTRTGNAQEAPFPVSVRDFGAKGDGVTDDTDAFQKAMDARSAAGGGVVPVPSGN